MSGMRQVLARVAALSAATMACLLLCLAFVGAAALGWGPPELAEHGLASIPWLAVGFTRPVRSSPGSGRAIRSAG